MITQILEGLTNLGFETALLEAFDWDEEKRDAFYEEFRYMMLAAPPNVDKALFWIRNTPWTSLDGEQLPDNVYNIIKDCIFQMRDALLERKKASQQRTVVELPHFRKNDNSSDPEEWN
tara:strand:- start:324 stop:677 length:354 start_codon:yes stop_codon:yes gene_type:complete